MSNSLRFFEFQKVAYKGKWQNTSFTKDLHKAFEAYYTKNPDTPFFELIPYGVRFKQYVGAIQIGKTTIEVLPKVGKSGNEDTWQKVLLDMLKICHLLTAKQTGDAHLKLKSNSILDLYFEMYILELENLLHKGLIKKYKPNSGQQKALKGALQFSKHLSKNIVHKERFYLNYTKYTKNHLLHQILFEALKVVSHISSNPMLKDRIGRIQLLFPEVTSLKTNKNHFTKIANSRKHKPYEKAISIAELILLNYRPDIKSGNRDLLALMFDMNMLWEEYVFRLLKKIHSKEYRILSQQKKLFWHKNQKIKPDIVMVEKSSNQTFVIDTKWKVLQKNRPSDDDLKQMYVYNHHWSAYKSILLYPKSKLQQSVEGNFALPMQNQTHTCQLLYVDVLENNQLNKNITNQVIEALEIEDKSQTKLPKNNL